MEEEKSITNLSMDSTNLNEDRDVTNKREVKEQAKYLEDLYLHKVFNIKSKEQIEFEKKYGENLEFALALDKWNLDFSTKKILINSFEKLMKKSTLDKSIQSEVTFKSFLRVSISVLKQFLDDSLKDSELKNFLSSLLLPKIVIKEFNDFNINSIIRVIIKDPEGLLEKNELLNLAFIGYLRC